MRPTHHSATVIALALLASLVAVTPSAAEAQDLALLLGQGETTVLVVVHGDSVRARSGLGLIVPRSSGWWRVGADAPKLGYPELAARVRPIWVRDSLRNDSLQRAYDARPAEPDTVAEPATAEAEERETNMQGEELGHEACFGHALWAVPLGSWPVIPDTICAEGADPAGEYSVSFVGPTHLTAYAGITTDYAYNFQRATIALPLDSLARHTLITFESDSAPYERDPASRIGVNVSDPRWVREVGRCGRDYRHDGDNDGETEANFDYRGSMIRRTAGRWKYVRYYANTSYVGRGAELDCETTYPVPDAITGPDRLTLPMTAIRRRVPGAVDAFTSPNGAVAVVLGATVARVFRVEGDRLGREVGRVPLATREAGWTTMAQWATGSAARRWERELVGVLPKVLPITKMAPS